jgi:phosphoribosylanthranilate isomerase
MTERRPLVKICGLTRAVDARGAVEAGADYVGVVLSAGFGRSVTAEAAARVLKGVELPRVAVVVDEAPEAVARAARAVRASVVQLHGSEDLGTVEALRRLGDWVIWKAVRARTADDVARAVGAFSGAVDGFLIEGWREGVIGGAGVRVAVAARTVRSAIPRERTFVLAGGLTPDNVSDAVARFSPEVVDVSSGVERGPGIKDPLLVRDFVHAAQGVIVKSSNPDESSA